MRGCGVVLERAIFFFGTREISRFRTRTFGAILRNRWFGWFWVLWFSWFWVFVVLVVLGFVVLVVLVFVVLVFGGSGGFCGLGGFSFGGFGFCGF